MCSSGAICKWDAVLILASTVSGVGNSQRTDGTGKSAARVPVGRWANASDGSAVLAGRRERFPYNGAFGVFCLLYADGWGLLFSIDLAGGGLAHIYRTDHSVESGKRQSGILVDFGCFSEWQKLK